jgi:hypothetical protein
MKNIKIELNREIWKSKVLIDGKEIENIRSVSAELRVGAIPVVNLEIIPETVDITGIADTFVRQVKL